MKHLKYIKSNLLQFFDVKINNDKSGKKTFHFNRQYEYVFLEVKK